MKINLSFEAWFLVFIGTTAAFKADIRADSNRDGIVDIEGDTDLLHKGECSNAAGAIFLANIGDTDRRCSKLALQASPPPSNEELASCNDASDDVQRDPRFLAPLRTVPISELSDSTVGNVFVDEPIARAKVRIFRHENEEWLFTPSKHEFTAAELKTGLKLGIDARDTRRPEVWDGRVTVHFRVKDGSSMSEDSVRLRVAPVMSHHHGQPTTEVFTTAGNFTSPIPFQAKFEADFIKALDKGDISYPLYQFNHSDDIWTQDFFEPGYTSMPGPENQPITLPIMIRSAQDSRVAGRQIFEYLRDAGRGAVQYPGPGRHEINSMGNFETIPPHTVNGRSYPAGRIILGTHGHHKPWILEYMKAQEVQDPVLLDTDWLAVGHVDEMVQFLPVSGDPSRDWVMAVADPIAGLDILRQVQDTGHGSTRAFSRPNNDTIPLPIPGGMDGVPNITVDEFLSSPEVFASNARFAARIEFNLNILKRETGIPSSHIHRVPSVFKTGHVFPPNVGDVAVSPSHNASAVHAASFYPGAVNGVVFAEKGVYLAPRQWGPMVDGRDVFGEAVAKVYEKLGYEVVYLDDWNSHHQWGGEVHCGSNTAREGDGLWWTA